MDSVRGRGNGIGTTDILFSTVAPQQPNRLTNKTTQVVTGSRSISCPTCRKFLVEDAGRPCGIWYGAFDGKMESPSLCVGVYGTRIIKTDWQSPNQRIMFSMGS